MSLLSESMFGKEIFELTGSGIRKESVELNALRIQRKKLQAIYTQVLPKVVPGLIGDLLSREREYNQSSNNNAERPMYTLELFTKNGTNPEKAKNYIFQKTGMRPAVYDKGNSLCHKSKVDIRDTQGDF